MSTAQPPAPASLPVPSLLRGAVHGLFYGLLAIMFVPAALGTGPVGAAGSLLGLGLALAYGIAARAQARGQPVGRELALAIVVSVLWLGLLALDTGASYLAFPLSLGYLYLGRCPGWPRLAALAAVAGATGAVVVAQATEPDGLTAAKVIGPVTGAAVAVLIAWGCAALYRENRARQLLINDLVRTRGELARTQREAGRLAERQRLAREIHDTLAQGLSSIVLLTRAADAALPDEPETVTSRARVREARRTAAANLDEARRFVQELTPPALAEASLPEALRRLAGRYENDPEVVFRVDGEPVVLPVEAEVALLRLTQEALANVARHARAGRATVTLAYLDDVVALDVFDDGVGFDPQAPSRPGAAHRPTFGLGGMRRRIAELGGSLTVESAPGEGTAVAAVLPLTVLAPAVAS